MKVYCVFTEIKELGSFANAEEFLIDIFSSKEEADKLIEYMEEKGVKNDQQDFFTEEWDIKDVFDKDDWDIDPVKIAHLD